ncbi:GRIP domain family protein [Leishmania donovani]|uniref:GRIP domain family protein n=1 Tax=Leishmania donovani TaxID=5661 RepID=A0A504WWR0_LEIDO|nr:GRIP domain family protein [Leishmania donovani]
MSSTANRTEDAASSALDGDDATAALLSSPAVTTATAEVAQLRQELHQCQEKFASWKAKAKTGVEQMRAQIVDLTCKLDESNKQRALLEASLGRGTALPALYVAQSQEFMYAHAIAAACLLVDTVLLSHSGGGPGQYKDTAATSPARSPTLQSTTTESLQKTVKDQSDRLKEAHHALKRLSNELQQRTAALHQQDENLADLRRRLAELEACNTSLKQQLMSVPNAQEWKHAQEELDQQLARTRLEYESRESQLVLQHSTEVQALKAVHEREVQDMQREQRDAVSQAERDTMAAEQQMLLRELQELLQSARGPLPASAANGTSTTAVTAADGTQATAGWDSFADTANLKEAVRRIHEQRLTFAKLQEELMHSRREVMQLRRCKAGPPEDGLSAQQLQYVRSVVVQLLCSLSDIRVARHLLPVLSMLLKFTDDDLQAITKAMLQ